MATPTTLPTTPNAESSPTRLSAMFGGTLSQSAGINQMLADLYNVWSKVGISESTPHDSPLANTVLASLANGKSGYRQVVAADITPGTATLLKIAEAVGTGSSGVLTFSSIPATYRGLQLWVYGRSDVAATNTQLLLRINGDSTAADYDAQGLSANAGTVSSYEALGTATSHFVGYLPAASSTANLYGSAVIWLPEYAQTSGWKTIHAFGGGQTHLTSTNMKIEFSSGAFESTAAISSLTLTLLAGNWTTASRVTLWGIPA